ncbi:MAG: hypothetical protein ACR2PT_16420 [Endozoicomonas sp.]
MCFPVAVAIFDRAVFIVIAQPAFSLSSITMQYCALARLKSCAPLFPFGQLVGISDPEALTRSITTNAEQLSMIKDRHTRPEVLTRDIAGIPLTLIHRNLKAACRILMGIFNTILRFPSA